MNLSLPWLARGEVGAKTFRDADRLVEFARGAVNYGPDEWRKLFAANSGGDDVRQTLIAAFGAASEYLTIQLAAVEKARALMQDAGPNVP